MQVYCSMQHVDKVEEPLLRTLDRIAIYVNEKKYSQALERFVNFMASLQVNAHPQVIEEAYSALDSLIDIADAFHKIEPSIRKLLNISSDDRYAGKQQQLAIKLAEWHYRQAKKQTEKNEKLKYFTNAIHYIGKASHLSVHPSSVIHGLASRIFKVSAVQLSVFQDRLEQAVSKVEKQQVFHLVENLKERFIPICCENEKNALIKLFFKQVSSVYTLTFNQRGQERLEACGLSTLYGPMENWLEKKICTDCFITTGYRQKFESFRSYFKDLYFNFLLKDPIIENVRFFQQKITKQFIAFIQCLLKDAFAILGDPPCNYDLRAMGSLAREEICPYSDLEWCILIEHEEHRLYFVRLAHLLELQIIGLGEDPAQNLPVFTCIAKKHLSGLHVDPGGNPAILHDLINTPELLAKKQTESDYQPNSLPNTLRKTISLMQSTPLLFERYQKSLHDNLEEKLQQESWRNLHAFQLLSARLQHYEETWKFPFESSLINLKADYTELLHHLLNDLSLYFGIEEANTLDLIDQFNERKIFQSESGLLLKEAVSSIYLIRVGLHFNYKEQKETALRFSCMVKEAVHSSIVLKETPSNQLEKFYWLVLRPLYRKLKNCLCGNSVFLEPHFQQIDLPKCAFIEEEKHPDTIMRLKPLIVHLVHHLVHRNHSLLLEKQEQHCVLHESFYKALSTMTYAEPLREAYLRTLEQYAGHPSIASLIDSLAEIPNPSGERQLHRMKTEQMQTAILAMTASTPQSPIPVFIRCPSAPHGRYLRKEVVEQILDDDGDLKRKYNDSAHKVAFANYRGYHLHFKQMPVHPLMEYAVHALTSRIGGHLTPPVELARLEVKGKIYPVLISQTVQGKILAKKNEIETASLTWASLCALLTLPGDGRFSNYIVENQTNRLFCVDNDISFVEPVTRGYFGHATHFASALFCLNPQPLNLDVLEAFILLDPRLILHNWIEDLIEKDNLYRQMQLFTGEEEKRFFGENQEDRFKATLLLRSGTVTTLLIQFHHLQQGLRQALKEKKTLYPLDLLSYLITLRDHQKQALNHWVYQDYKNARDSNLSPERRLHIALNREVRVSIQSSQSDGISFGKPPTIEEIQKREEYSPEKAKEELLAFTLSDGMRGVFSFCQSHGKEYIKANFRRIVKYGMPDLERQAFILKALVFLVERKTIKPHEISLANCDVLDLVSLKPFLHADLESLNLSGCSLIKENVIQEIEKQCTGLKKLYLNQCGQLKAFEKQATLFTSASDLNFPELEVLQIRRCKNLESIHLNASNLKELIIDHNPRLKTLILKPDSLYFSGSFKGCISLDLEKIRQGIRELERVNLLEKTLNTPFHGIENGTELNLSYKSIEDEGAKVLGRALALNSSVTAIFLGGNRIGDEGAKALAAVIADHPSITKIDLSNNEIGNEGAEALCKAIASNSSLTIIDLIYNKIGKKGIENFHEAFAKNHSLTLIDLRYNRIFRDFFSGTIIFRDS